jgi:non-heme chloroperoxidase
VLDWGGTGRPLVLLAGLGHTAHIFDTLAPNLTAFFHVYAITRRGFGSSTYTSSGYTQSRLADDVMAVIDHFHLTGTVLAGHSFAGQELTSIGIRRPERIAGLVYLDAAGDDLSGIEDNPKLQAIMRELPQPRPTRSDLTSFSALQAWWTRT